MKAFEEWFNGSVCAIGDADVLKQHKSRYASAWLAALNMVLKQMDQNKFMANGELRTWIKQELEDIE